MDIKDENKKKLWISIAFIAIIAVIFTVIISVTITNKYNQNMLYFCSNVMDNITSKYPDSEAEVINNIFVKNDSTSGTLNKYGVDIDTIDFKVDFLKFSTLVMVLLTCLFAVILLSFVIIIYKYIRKQDKKIEKINEYSDEILNNNYNLDIRDNDESNLSILKNKIYDMTVMLKEKNNLLEEDKIKIEQLIADISHQIKTPLTSLNLLNDLLYEDLPEEKKNEFLNDMSQELLKIKWLITNLLNIAKIDSKTLILKNEQVDLKSILEKCRKNFEVLAQLENIQINIHLTEKITITVDEKWTSEAINNLIKNAIEHGATIIDIICSQTILYKKIVIKDNGEGIDKDDLPYIFNRFYKAKNSRSDSMGLGLAFVKSIVINQNGDIHVKSKKTKGTEFVIKLYENNI